MLKAKDQIYARMYVVLTLLSLLPLLVVGRVISIHLTEGKELRAQGERQARSFQEIPALRGSILDAGGRTLASNSARYTLSVDPTMGNFRQEAETFYQRLQKLTGRQASYFRSKVANRKSPKYVTLLKSVSEVQQETIQSWGMESVILEPRFSRTYNYGKSLSHVLGHVSADNRGIAGLEMQYNTYLQGTAGRLAVKRDRMGELQAVAGGALLRPVQGQSLTLTIDLVHQSILEQELARGMAESGARWATGIAMDPETGAILAMANYPDYDPNRPAAFGTESRRNHAITDRIEPGSTFKLVSAVAALEQKAVSLTDSIETGVGYAIVAGTPITDTHGHGTITFQEAISLSSNIAVAKVSENLDRGKLYQYARNLGFGQPTWLDLPGEVGGRLKKPSEWSKTSPSRISIGYEVEVTPLQVLTAYAAMANGGLLVQPYVVASREDMSGRTIWKARQDSVRRAFKASTARRLATAFENVVTEGTATEASLEGVRIAGKTGTANKVVNGVYDTSKSRASFVGYFPVEDPKVVMVIIMDEPKTSPYGGVVAAPVFKRVAERWINTMPGLYRVASTLNKSDSDEQHDSLVTVPDVRGLPVPIAYARLTATGLNVRGHNAATDSSIVAEQHPAPGTTTETPARVRLEIADRTTGDNAVMPDLTGLSIRHAANWLMANGINVTVQGHGSIKSHSPKSGDPLHGKAVLRATG